MNSVLIQFIKKEIKGNKSRINGVCIYLYKKPQYPATPFPTLKADQLLTLSVLILLVVTAIFLRYCGFLL